MRKCLIKKRKSDEHWFWWCWNEKFYPNPPIPPIPPPMPPKCPTPPRPPSFTAASFCMMIWCLKKYGSWMIGWYCLKILQREKSEWMRALVAQKCSESTKSRVRFQLKVVWKKSVFIFPTTNKQLYDGIPKCRSTTGPVATQHETSTQGIALFALIWIIFCDLPVLIVFFDYSFVESHQIVTNSLTSAC